MPPTTPGTYRDHLKTDDNNNTPLKSPTKRYTPLHDSIPEEEIELPSRSKPRRSHSASISDSFSDSDDSDDDDDETSKLRRVSRSTRRSKSKYASAAATAYIPVMHKSNPHNLETYLDSITEAEQELLSASKNELDVEDDDDFDDSDYETRRAKRRARRRSYLAKDKLKGWRGVYYSKYAWRTLLVVVLGLVMLVLGFLGVAKYRGTRKTNYFYVDSASWFPSPKGGTLPHWAESYEKAAGLVRNMTLIEKVNITTGTGWQMGLCVGNTAPAEFVKFPSLCLQDGPMGLRLNDHVSAFPAGITTGATWNRDLINQRGLAMGQEARMKGVNVLLGPSMGPLGIHPAGGRNWESFGSDPVLQGIAAAETIRGIQSTGVMATAKHFVMNEQEHFRQPFEWGIPHALSSNIGDRALHEVFIWPFAESIRADVASVMCSYQMVNNSHSCENSKLLNGVLKDELAFQGFVQSDWLAQRSGVNSALGGLDMSMPGDGVHWADGRSFWGSELTRAVLNTTIPVDRLNDMVTRIVAAWYQLGQNEWEPKGPNFSSWTDDQIGWLHHGSDDESFGVVNSHVDVQGTGNDSHSIIARKVAAEGTVLLKNLHDTLPLRRVDPSAGGFYRVGVYGDDAGPGMGPNTCPDRGCNQGTLASGWGSSAVEFPYLVTPLDALQAAWAGQMVEISPYLRNGIMPADVEDKDLCLVFVNADSGEGFIHHGGIHGDRNDLFLQRGGDTLIQRVAGNCGGGHGRTVVVIHAVGPVVMESWIDLPGVYAVVHANLPGQESGNALVDVLFGDVDASGRLPYTIGKSLEDYGPTAQVLYEPNATVPQVDFSDALYIDYRYFDRHNITPRYEFGFGLSYTTFDLSELKVSSVQWTSPPRLPAPRPSQAVSPPLYDNKPPVDEPVLFPEDFQPIHKYIYPYLTDMEGADAGNYSYPKDYNLPQPPSPAGGGAGGNPSLYDPVAEVQVSVTNTGARSGQEVVQVYVAFPSDVMETQVSKKPTVKGKPAPKPIMEKITFPERVLRNFTKVLLEPGEKQTVKMTLSRKDLSYWSVRQQNWLMPDGEFEILVGRSSRDLPLVGRFH